MDELYDIMDEYIEDFEDYFFFPSILGSWVFLLMKFYLKNHYYF